MSRRSISCLMAAGLLAAGHLAACSSSPLEGESKDRLIEMYVGNAQLYLEGGHYRSAQAQANQALALEPENQQARLVRAMASLNIGDPKDVQEARSELEELVKEDHGPRQFRVWICLGMARAAVGDLYDARRRKIVKQIESDPMRAKDLIPPRDEATAKRDAEYRSSNEAFLRVLAYEDIPLARNDPTSLYYLYRNLSLLGRYEEALAYELRHLKVIEGSAQQWRKSIEQYPDAKEIYEQKLAGARKQEIAVRDMLATTYFHLDRLPDALAQLDQLVSLAPNRAETYLNRAQLHRKLGRHDLAVVDLKRFIQKTDLAPEDPQAVKAVELLRDSEAKMADSP